MENNCFINSPVSNSRFNLSSIVIVETNSTVVSINNYVDAVQTELTCPYVIEFGIEYPTFQCRKNVVFDAATCSRSGSGAPTGTTTAMPVVATPAPAATSPNPTAPPSSQQPVFTTATPAPTTQGPISTTTTPAPTTQGPISTTTTPTPPTQGPISTTTPAPTTTKAPTSAGHGTEMGVWTAVVVLVVQVLSHH